MFHRAAPSAWTPAVENELLHLDGQWTRAKGFDSFCPLGPWIETDLDPHDFADGRRVQTHLNGDLDAGRLAPRT